MRAVFYSIASVLFVQMSVGALDQKVLSTIDGSPTRIVLLAVGLASILLGLYFITGIDENG